MQNVIYVASTGLLLEYIRKSKDDYTSEYINNILLLDEERIIPDK